MATSVRARALADALNRLASPGGTLSASDREALVAEFGRLRAIEDRAEEMHARRDKNTDPNPHESRRVAFYIRSGRWPTW